MWDPLQRHTFDAFPHGHCWGEVAAITAPGTELDTIARDSSVFLLHYLHPSVPFGYHGDSLYWAECWQEEVWITGLKVRKGCNVLNIAHSLWSWRCKTPWVVVVITAFDAIPVVSCCHESANRTFTTRLWLHIHLTLFIKDMVCSFWDKMVVLGMMMSQGQQSRKCSHSFSPI